jgi:RimJ/RimL family protein N-acetyltransferase
MLKFRQATIDDCLLYFEWTNDKEVRQQSFNSSDIIFEEHKAWFTKVLNDESTVMLVFEDVAASPIGQVRIQKKDNNISIIGISVDASARGKGYAVTMLQMASNFYLEHNQQQTIYAYIKKQNIASTKAFENAGFLYHEQLEFDGIPSYLYIKKLN